MKLEIKKFRKEYAENCQRIIYTCIDVAKKMSSKDKKTLKKRYSIRDILSYSKISDFFVVLSRKEIIGTGRLEKNQIATIYFLPKYQKRGGGSLILNFLIGLARKRSQKSVYVKSLMQSTGFYEKIGFNKKKILVKPIKAYRMEKRL